MATPQQIQQVAAKMQDEFAKQRVMKLSGTIFPKEEHHPKFQETLMGLLKYNSFKQMGSNPDTWKNMCSFEREFLFPEMELCIEILLRCTALETVSFTNKDGSIRTNKEIMDEFNNVVFPGILEIVRPMKKVLNMIDDSVSTPIANKLESDAKISLQLPIGTQIKFIQRQTYN
jgi:hypothetical protein